MVCMHSGTDACTAAPASAAGMQHGGSQWDATTNSPLRLPCGACSSQGACSSSSSSRPETEAACRPPAGPPPRGMYMCVLQHASLVAGVAVFVLVWGKLNASVNILVLHACVLRLIIFVLQHVVCCSCMQVAPSRETQARLAGRPWPPPPVAGEPDGDRGGWMQKSQRLCVATLLHPGSSDRAHYLAQLYYAGGDPVLAML